MHPTYQNEDDDLGIDFNQYNKELDNEDLGIDMNEYSQSQEKQVAGWQNTLKDVIIQPALGALKAFTWPADLLKLGMVGEALTGVDELEEAYRNAGIPFDRNEYYKNVAETSEFIPTQELAEKLVGGVTGIDLEPSSDVGKNLRKFFTLFSISPGGLVKKASSAALGTATSSLLKGAGVPEPLADIGGDVTGVGVTSLAKVPRQFNQPTKELVDIADKYALPIFEFMAKDEKQLINPRITQATEKSLKKEFKVGTEEAIDNIIKGSLPVARLRERGINLDNFASYAKNKTLQMARRNPQKINMAPVINEIDQEIARIKNLAPSPSQSNLKAIKILEEEKEILKRSTPTSEQLINQHYQYNSNVKSIYRKPEFSGDEEAVRSAYKKLNNAIINAIETQGQRDVANAFKASNLIFNQKENLLKTENTLRKAFPNGEYSPKKLQNILQSKQGKILRREVGDKAVNELGEIAKYGVEAEKRVAQLAKRANGADILQSWGPLAPFMLAQKGQISTGILKFAHRASELISGRLLARPLTRTIYKDIIKNIGKGGLITSVKADFDKLEKAITEEYGSMDDFFNDVKDELQIWNDED